MWRFLILKSKIFIALIWIYKKLKLGGKNYDKSLVALIEHIDDELFKEIEFN